MLKVVELFAGIGAQASALERLGIEFESTVCEFEEHAYRAYCAIHGPTPNLGDITKVEHLPECDLLTYSPPCQDISIAGLKKGLVEGSGTRSSLFWEVLRLLKDAKERERLPRVMVMENVDAIINKENRPHLDRFIIELNKLGYTSTWQIMNAKDYGVAQNRKRFFMVSTLDNRAFVFPEKQILTKRLKDYLESDVDESYYLSPEKIAKYESHKRKQKELGNGFGYRPLDPERESIIHDLNQPIKELHKYGKSSPKIEGQLDAGLNDGERETEDAQLIIAGTLHQWNYDKMGRVYDPEGIAPTIETPTGGGRMPKIEVTGIIPDMGFEQNQRVHSIEGIAPTVHTKGGGMILEQQAKPTMNGGKIMIDGYIGKKFQFTAVYDPEGIAPTLVAGLSHEGMKIIERKEEDD